jgi:hypothetical protein
MEAKHDVRSFVDPTQPTAGVGHVETLDSWLVPLNLVLCPLPCAVCAACLSDNGPTGSPQFRFATVCGRATFVFGAVLLVMVFFAVFACTAVEWDSKNSELCALMHEAPAFFEDVSPNVFSLLVARAWKGAVLLGGGTNDNPALYDVLN